MAGLQPLRDTPKRAIWLYLGLTFAFSAVVWTFIIWSGHLYMGFGLMIPGIMWCPGLAAMMACRLLGRRIRSLAWCWPSSRYLFAAYFVPLTYASIAYVGVWAWRLAGWNSEFVHEVAQSFELHGMPAWCSFTLYVVSMATGGVLENLSTTLGEEIGWRGFLVPELANQMSFTKVSLLSGIVWAAWHSPLLLFADYNVGTNRWYALGCSTVTVISLSFVLAWLRLKSESIWPAALMHASHNLFIPGIFNNLVRDTGQTYWYTTEFGAALAVAGVMFALYFWTRRNEIRRCNPRTLSVQTVSS